MAHVARVTSLGALSASIATRSISRSPPSSRMVKPACAGSIATPPGSDEVSSSRPAVIANGKRASEIVQRVRALTGKTERHRSLLNFNGLVEEVVPLVRREAARYRAVLRLELAANLPAILGRSDRASEVIINLIINAVQAMATVRGLPHTVVVTTRADGPIPWCSKWSIPALVSIP